VDWLLPLLRLLAGVLVFLTLHLGPEEVLLNISVDFTEALTSVDGVAELSLMEQAIKDLYPQVNHQFIEVRSRAGHHACVKSAPKG